MTGAWQEKCRATLTCDAGKKVFQMDDITRHPVTGNIEFILARLLVARSEAATFVNFADMLGIGLRGGLISAEEAVERLESGDYLELLDGMSA